MGELKIDDYLKTVARAKTGKYSYLPVSPHTQQ
jgi:hypothetical protein